MKTYPHLAAMLYNTPLLLHPDKAEVIERVFASHLLEGIVIDAQAVDRPAPEALAFAAPQFGDKPYVVTAGRAAVIPVMGSLVQRASGMDAASGLTGYNRLERLVRTAAADPDVRGILLEMDSPGGQGAGLFDLADMVAGLDKPVWAAVNEMAYSAGYALAAAADRVTLTRTAGVGSIGVIALHMDQSERDAKDGRRYTAIYAGARKNDFSSHAPLSTEAYAVLQASIERMYGLFVEHVARNRNLSPERVRATEAGLFEGAMAVEAGLADAVQPFNDTLAEFERELARNTIGFSTLGATARHTGVHSMNESQNPSAGGETANEARFTQADIDTARAAAHAEGVEVGASAERARVSAILGHASASCSDLALQCVSTGLTAEQATAILGAAPPAAVQQSNAFAAAMSAMGNPQVSGIEASADEVDSESAMAAQILAAFSNATVRQ